MSHAGTVLSSPGDDILLRFCRAVTEFYPAVMTGVSIWDREPAHLITKRGTSNKFNAGMYTSFEEREIDHLFLLCDADERSTIYAELQDQYDKQWARSFRSRCIWIPNEQGFVAWLQQKGKSVKGEDRPRAGLWIGTDFDLDVAAGIANLLYERHYADIAPLRVWSRFFIDQLTYQFSRTPWEATA